jgi:hypothetical protein
MKVNAILSSSSSSRNTHFSFRFGLRLGLRLGLHHGHVLHAGTTHEARVTKARKFTEV